MKITNRNTIVMLALALVLFVGACSPTGASPTGTGAPIEVAGASQEMILATTTSTEDSGLLDVILPEFEKVCGCTVGVVAVGSGQALQ
ncbi:MAG: substrate-binding domain-containing protein, partial [Bellilinea sp.]